jgi:phospholipid transport system substrate-binding protein
MSLRQFLRAGAIALLLTFPAATAFACSGENLVMGAGRAFTAASKSGSATAFLNAASRYADVRGIAASALGPHRKKLTKAQEAQYFRLAPAFMGKFMARYANNFNASGMKITTCSSGTITATTASGKKIIFRVSGGRVRDVNVSSIWLAGQMRSTFVGVINRNGGNVDALIRYLGG